MNQINTKENKTEIEKLRDVAEISRNRYKYGEGLHHRYGAMYLLYIATLDVLDYCNSDIDLYKSYIDAQYVAARFRFEVLSNVEKIQYDPAKQDFFKEGWDFALQQCLSLFEKKRAKQLETAHSVTVDEGYNYIISQLKNILNTKRQKSIPVHRQKINETSGLNKVLAEIRQDTLAYEMYLLKTRIRDFEKGKKNRIQDKTFTYALQEKIAVEFANVVRDLNN